MSFVSRSLHAPLKAPSLVKVSAFCKFCGPTASGSAKTQNHRSRVAAHALTDQNAFKAAWLHWFSVQCCTYAIFLCSFSQLPFPFNFQTANALVLKFGTLPLSGLLSNTLLALFDIYFLSRVIHCFVPKIWPKLTCRRVFQHKFISQANLKKSRARFLVIDSTCWGSKKNVSGKAGFEHKSDRIWGIFGLFSPY